MPVATDILYAGGSGLIRPRSRCVYPGRQAGHRGSGEGGRGYDRRRRDIMGAMKLPIEIKSGERQ